jgi:hypothetical protein
MGSSPRKLCPEPVNAGACYNESSAIRIVSQFLVAGESYTGSARGGCIEVKLKSAERFELIKKLLKAGSGLRNSYSYSSTSSNQAVFSAQTCRFFLEKKGETKTKEYGANFSKKSKISSVNSKNRTQSKSMLVVQSGMKASFQVFDQSIWYKCQYAANGTYMITLSMNDQFLSISTAIMLGKGQTIDIGGQVDQIVDKDHSIEAPKKVEFKKRITDKQFSIKLVRP